MGTGLGWRMVACHNFFGPCYACKGRSEVWQMEPPTCANTAATGVAWGELQSLVMAFSCCLFMLRVTGAVLSLEKFRLKED